jgi:hypothetical protein
MVNGAHSLLLLSGLVASMSGGVAPGPPPPPADAPPEGVGYHVSGTARVIGGDRVRFTVACTEGTVECRGTVRLRSRAKVATRAGGKPRIVTIVEGSYGAVPPGGRKQVTLRLRREARHHVRSHRATAARIGFRNEATRKRLPLSDRVTVRNPSS